MENKYLNNNPIDWLLEDNDPCISYLTKKEILRDGSHLKCYDKIFESKKIQKIFKGNPEILGSIKHFDIFYKGAMWHFAETVERGLDKRTETIQKTAESIIKISQLDSGGFTLDWQPCVAVACRTGDMVKFLLRAGFDNESVQKGIAWITFHQRHDGGWLHCPLSGICDQIKLVLFKKSGNGLSREKNTDVTSCFYATIACSMALVEYKLLTGTNRFDSHLMKAANFFLARSLYKNSDNDPIKPNRYWNKDFRLLGYPVLSQYDILYGLLFLAKAGFINDQRSGESFNIIMSKQNDDGTWNLENAETGMMYGDKRKAFVGKKSKWVTLNVLRLLAYLGGSIK